MFGAGAMGGGGMSAFGAKPLTTPTTAFGQQPKPAFASTSTQPFTGFGQAKPATTGFGAPSTPFQTQQPAFGGGMMGQPKSGGGWGVS